MEKLEIPKYGTPCLQSGLLGMKMTSEQREIMTIAEKVNEIIEELNK